MAIRTELEVRGNSRGSSFEPPTRRSRLYFTIVGRPVSRPGGAPSSTDLLSGGSRIEDPGTKLGQLPQLHDTDTTSTPGRQSVPTVPTAHIPSGFDAEQKPSSGHF